MENYIKISKDGRKMPVRYLATSRLDPLLVEIKSLDYPWNNISKRLFRAAAKELIKYKKISDPDLLRIQRLTIDFVTAKRKEIEYLNTERVTSAHDHRIRYRSISLAFLTSIVPNILDNKLQIEKKSNQIHEELKKCNESEILHSIKKVLKLTIESISEETYDNTLKNRILTNLQGKIRKFYSDNAIKIEVSTENVEKQELQPV